MEAAADLVVDPAARHLAERGRHDLQRVVGAGAPPVSQQEIERHRLRKLRRAVEAAVARVEALGDRAIGAIERVSR